MTHSRIQEQEKEKIVAELALVIEPLIAGGATDDELGGAIADFFWSRTTVRELPDGAVLVCLLPGGRA